MSERATVVNGVYEGVLPHFDIGLEHLSINEALARLFGTLREELSPQFSHFQIDISQFGHGVLKHATPHIRIQTVRAEDGDAIEAAIYRAVDRLRDKETQP